MCQMYRRDDRNRIWADDILFFQDFNKACNSFDDSYGAGWNGTINNIL